MTSWFPRVRYADADGVNIAYEVRGTGPIDLIRVPGVNSGILAGYVDASGLGRMLDRLASFSRLIVLDRRGLGLSDPLHDADLPPIEQQARDIIAVMDAADTSRAALLAGGDGSFAAIFCAAMHPERVDALVIVNGTARFFRADDYPFGPDPARQDRLVRLVKQRWGDLDQPLGVEALAPSRLHEPGFREVFAGVQQVSASKAAAAAALYNIDLDVRALLPLVQVPVLVLHAADAQIDAREQSRYLGTHIPNARTEPVAGPDLYIGVYGEEWLALIEEFLTGTRPEPLSDRVLATVLFTDIVVSTEHLARVGDREWRHQLDRHDAMVREQLDRFHGREIKTSGDSLFATLDGPAQAIGCARAIIDSAQRLGFEIRAGVHTGECERRGDDLAGIAVHIGSRIAAMADASQILVTSTVKDLVAGSGITFVDEGMRPLKGVPEQWHIYRVV
jgi:class 3 adenylate cyclase